MRSEKKRQYFSPSLLLSLAFHAGVFIVFILVINKRTNELASKKNWIQVELPPLKPVQKDQQPVQENKRIVQTEKENKTLTAASDANLGEQNQKLDRQTVSKNRLSKMGTSRNQMAKNLAQSPATPSKDLSKLGLNLFGTVKLHPNPANPPSWAPPSTNPEDYVPGIQESDRTALNTKEFKFYGYFQRIRERLDHAWVPVLKEKLVAYYYSGRKLAPDMDHVTKLLVVLNSQGEITRVVVLEESGTHELDSAAIAAFNKAGPFPNPPTGIIDGNKEVKIPWDFILRT